jgi:hypothetical protein
MKIDEITDIKVLRKLAKSCRAKLKQDVEATDGSDYMFKKGEWYLVSQDEYGVTLYSEDEADATLDMSYEEAKQYLEHE